MDDRPHANDKNCSDDNVPQGWNMGCQKRGPKILNRLRIIWMLLPAPQRMACSSSPSSPFGNCAPVIHHSSGGRWLVRQRCDVWVVLYPHRAFASDLTDWPEGCWINRFCRLFLEILASRWIKICKKLISILPVSCNYYPPFYLNIDCKSMLCRLVCGFFRDD